MDVEGIIVTEHNKICSLSWKQMDDTKLLMLYWDVETLLKSSSSSAGATVHEPWSVLLLLAIVADPVTFISKLMFPSYCNR
jgi:hypothetical protein